MFAAERQARIKDIVTEYKYVDVSTLVSMLQVTEVTIRRDLELLEKDGVLIKLHGGAMLNDNGSSNSTIFTSYTPPDIATSNLHAKQEIAKVASMLLQPYDTIFIGGGTTCTCFANNLASLEPKPNITIVTNNFQAAIHLINILEYKVVLTGGELFFDHGCAETYGQFTDIALGMTFFTKTFITVAAVSLEHGYMQANDRSLSINKQVIKKSSNTYILADYTKFDKISMLQLCSIDSIRNVVSNENISDAFKSYYFNNNIKLYTTIDYPNTSV